MDRDLGKFDQERLSMQLYIHIKPRLKEIVEQIIDERLLADTIDKCLKDYLSVIKSARNELTQRELATHLQEWVFPQYGNHKPKWWNQKKAMQAYNQLKEIVEKHFNF